MRRRLASVFAVALAGGTVPALAAAPPRAELTQFTCQRAERAPNRAISVLAVMRPRPRTQRMELKFTLLQRTPMDQRFKAVAGKGLGVWRHPSPANLGQRPDDVWRFSKLVVSLPAPAVYRLRVTFRWVLTSGRVQSVLWSPRCYQR